MGMVYVGNRNRIPPYKNLIGGELTFYQNILSMFRGDFVGYWPQNELTGSIAYDISPQANNGAYTGVTLANAALPEKVGGLAPLFNGSGYNNIDSVGLDADFNGAEGTFFGLYKAFNVGVWTDTMLRYLWRCYVDANNEIRIYRSATNNRLSLEYQAGGTSLAANVDGLSYTGWFGVGLQWSKAGNYVRWTINGVQIGSVLTGLGTFVGVPSIHLVGYSGGSGWNGWIGHPLILNTPISDTNMLILNQLAGVA